MGHPPLLLDGLVSEKVRIEGYYTAKSTKRKA